jgi:hypothetical protein
MRDDVQCCIVPQPECISNLWTHRVLPSQELGVEEEEDDAATTEQPQNEEEVDGQFEM